MKLYEKEAKDLISEAGVSVPGNGDGDQVVKAQVLSKNRKEHGGIRFTASKGEAQRIAENMKGSKVNGDVVDDVLIEQRMNILEEHYVSFLYDTDSRSPVLLFSKGGGTGVEDEEVRKLEVGEPQNWKFRQFLKEQGVDSQKLTSLASTVEKLYRCFLENDMRMLEVNPLAETPKGIYAIDAVAELEDDASFRQNWNYPERTEFSRSKTEREKKAEKIDEEDHRGVAGKYVELDGDIAMMLAGGGASLTNMDAMMAAGGKPANYTEYGGNPPTEKVYRLSKVIMSKPDLKGLWHVGGTANNTDVERTMKGFVKALREEKPDYPIVVRRDGPNADAGFELLREVRDELGLRMELYRNDTPMTQTAERVMEMVEDG